MMKDIREIIELGNPLLREVAKPVTDVQSPEVKDLIRVLDATCKASKGMGIAAPQLGVSLRVFVVVPYQYGTDFKIRPEPIIVINPKLTPVGRKTEEDWEGCLSIPGLRGIVSRHTQMNVSYIDPDGESKTIKVDDLVARIFQHENDHLDGVMFLDRILSVKDLITDREYFRQAEEQK